MIGTDCSLHQRKEVVFGDMERFLEDQVRYFIGSWRLVGGQLIDCVLELSNGDLAAAWHWVWV